MLVALDLFSHRTLAATASRLEGHFCPGCGEPVVVKRGLLKAPHFAHQAGSECSYGAGETKLHQDIKYALLAHHSRAGAKVCEAEFWHPSIKRRSDVYVETADGRRIGFEVQVSGITAEEVVSRTQDYSSIGVSVCWVIPIEGTPSYSRWPSKTVTEGAYRARQTVREFLKEYALEATEGVVQEAKALYTRLVYEAEKSFLTFPPRRINSVEKAIGPGARLLYVKENFDGRFHEGENRPKLLSSGGFSASTFWLVARKTHGVPPPWY